MVDAASCEIWVQPRVDAAAVPEVARELEDWGFDGAVFGDSPTISGDVFVTLGAVSVTSSRLKFGTGVTNMVTRSPSQLAYASAWLQKISSGRFSLGIGRGDSAVSLVGHRPATIAEFTEALDEFESSWNRACRDLALPPTASPVDVTATGPRMIELGASHADAVSLMVGGNPSRLEESIASVQESATRRDSCRPPIRISAYIPVGCAETKQDAVADVRGLTATFARFGSDGRAEQVRRSYDFSSHGSSSSEASMRLSDEDVLDYALVTTPSALAENVQAIAAMGFDRLILLTGSRFGVGWPERRRSIQNLARSLKSAQV